MTDPITLEEFNMKPHLSPAFFELGMEVVGEMPTTPWTIQDQGVLRIKAWDVIRYKVSGNSQFLLTIAPSTSFGTWETRSRES